MNKTLPQFFKDEYSHFRKDLLEKWGVTEPMLLPLEALLKQVHKRYLSLACTATVITRRAKRKDYAVSVVEVGYISLAITLKGLETPALVLLRQCIELVLKHIYFAFHPVEYHWASTREDYRDLSFQTLLDFVRRTDEHHDLAARMNICEKLQELYGVLSRHVHVHGARFMRYNMIGTALKPDASILKEFNRRTKELWPLLVILLVTFFPKNYHHAQEIERRLITSSIQPSMRGFLQRYWAEHSKSQYQQV